MPDAPMSLMVLPSDPPFRIDLQAARSYANMLALSTLAPGLQRLTVIYGSQPERASSNALWAPPARAVIVGRKNCDLRAHTVSLSQEFLRYSMLSKCMLRVQRYVGPTCMSLTAQLTSWSLGADGGSQGR